MPRELRSNPNRGSPIIGLVLAWGGGVVLVIAFVIAWLVRIDQDMVIDFVDDLSAGLVSAAKRLLR
jgi:hypothetical protein